MPMTWDPKTRSPMRGRPTARDLTYYCAPCAPRAFFPTYPRHEDRLEAHKCLITYEAGLIAGDGSLGPTSTLRCPCPCRKER
jgi:hypothetical protein